MSTSSTATPVAGDGLASSLVAGVVLGTTIERHTDSVVGDLVDRLSPSMSTTDVMVATHWIPVGDRQRSCLSVQLPSGDVALAWRTLLAALPSGVDTALACCLGERHTGPDDLWDAAGAAAHAHAVRSSGRAVHFPGASSLVGTMSVREMLVASSIDQVRVLAAGEADPDMLVITRDHVRPLWSRGQLVLFTQPAAGETLVPFESPNPTPCCAAHG